MIKFYNTLGRKVEEFKPIEPGTVKLYTCGPTVYDYMHIGNLRKFVFDDTIRRTLEANGLKVKHTMNITDVGHLVSDDDEGEDKLEKGAKREDKTVWEVAEHYIQAFTSDMQAMNNLPPNAHLGTDPYSRATEFIPQQIEMVKALIDKGFAYQTDQAIYFDVTKLESYGELTGQKLSDKEVAARKDVVTDQNKHHPQDFAVWFFCVGRFANHDMRWDSPWGQGFPGWHLECSAIVHAVLGDPIDIHTGGVDNIGTHHVNEMAQTQAAFGHKLANYWIHSEHLLIDGKRMGKSLGNFLTLNDIVKRGYNPLALRLLYLQAHYRSQTNFTWESLEAAQVNLKSLQAFAGLRFHIDFVPRPLLLGDDFFKDAKDNIQRALNNDLATPEALAELNELIDYVMAKAGGIHPSRHMDDFNDFLDFLDKTLGLELLETKDIDDGQKKLVFEREAAREAKDWDKSDQLRDELQGQGIELNDTQYGPIWSRL